MSNHQKSPVFEETYQRYLEQIGKIDFLAKADLLGVSIENDQLVVPLFDRMYRVSSQAITDIDGNKELNSAIRVIVSKYVLHCETTHELNDDPYRTFRDFKDSSPLISYFTTNTNKTLESSFAGKVDELLEAGTNIGGVPRKNDSFDCSLVFRALPKIPIVLNFNDRDELFPASCSILYRASAETYLDMECLAMTGTLLTGRLLQAAEERV